MVLVDIITLKKNFFCASFGVADGCDPPCSAYNACGNCTTAGCMWCSNPMQCIDTNSYVASFHYGQCKDWATKSAGLTCLGKRRNFDEIGWGGKMSLAQG